MRINVITMTMVVGIRGGDEILFIGMVMMMA